MSKGGYIFIGIVVLGAFVSAVSARLMDIKEKRRSVYLLIGLFGIAGAIFGGVAGNFAYDAINQPSEEMVATIEPTSALISDVPIPESKDEPLLTILPSILERKTFTAYDNRFTLHNGPGEEYTSKTVFIVNPVKVYGIQGDWVMVELTVVGTEQNREIGWISWTDVPDDVMFGLEQLRFEEVPVHTINQTVGTNSPLGLKEVSTKLLEGEKMTALAKIGDEWIYCAQELPNGVPVRFFVQNDELEMD